MQIKYLTEQFLKECGSLGSGAFELLSNHWLTTISILNFKQFTKFRETELSNLFFADVATDSLCLFYNELV